MFWSLCEFQKQFPCTFSIWFLLPPVTDSDSSALSDKRSPMTIHPTPIPAHTPQYSAITGSQTVWFHKLQITTSSCLCPLHFPPHSLLRSLSAMWWYGTTRCTSPSLSWWRRTQPSWSTAAGSVSSTARTAPSCSTSVTRWTSDLDPRNTPNGRLFKQLELS